MTTKAEFLAAVQVLTGDVQYSLEQRVAAVRKARRWLYELEEQYNSDIDETARSCYNAFTRTITKETSNND